MDRIHDAGGSDEPGRDGAVAAALRPSTRGAEASGPPPRPAVAAGAGPVPPKPAEAGRSLAGLFKRPPLLTAIGLGLLVLSALAQATGVAVFGPLHDAKFYKYASGFALLGYIAVQWVLFARRERGDKPDRTAWWYRWHKRLGVFAPVLLVLHASSFGYGTLGVLSGCFLLTAATGLLHRDVLAVRSEVFWRLWIIVHTGSAFGLYALVALHVWVALFFTR